MKQWACGGIFWREHSGRKVHSEVFYEAAAMLTTFSLLGHWMEMAARNTTGAFRFKTEHVGSDTALAKLDLC
jgi:cation transport ATPase